MLQLPKKKSSHHVVAVKSRRPSKNRESEAMRRLSQLLVYEPQSLSYLADFDGLRRLRILNQKLDSSLNISHSYTLRIRTVSSVQLHLSSTRRLDTQSPMSQGLVTNCIVLSVFSQENSSRNAFQNYLQPPSLYQRSVA